MDPSPVLLAVDGNSLLHRSFHALAGSGARTALGEPVWAVRGLLTQLVAAAERIAPTMVVVGLDDPASSLRRERWPGYKAQRPEKVPSLVSQLARAAEVLAGLGVAVVVPPGLEADDVLASAARAAASWGGRSVLVTSDRDAFALIDGQTSVLRVIRGGVEASPLLTPDRLRLMLGVGPEHYPDLAALRGDPSDNLPGVPGIGPKRAAALLSGLGSAAAVFDDVDAGGERVRALVGPGLLRRLAEPSARECWRRNREVMAFHHDLELGLHPGAGPGRLPLSVEVVDRELLGHGLPATARVARRCLCAEPDPDPSPPAVDVLPWDARAEWRSRPNHPPLPARPTVPEPHPTLF